MQRQAHTRHTCKHYRLLHVCRNTLPQLKDQKHQLYCLIFHNILLNETAAQSTFSNPSKHMKVHLDTFPQFWSTIMIQMILICKLSRNNVLWHHCVSVQRLADESQQSFREDSKGSTAGLCVQGKNWEICWMDQWFCLIQSDAGLNQTTDTHFFHYL